MSLDADNLTVESFVTTSAMNADAAAIGGGSVFPECIVYVTDCVPCN